MGSGTADLTFETTDGTEQRGKAILPIELKFTRKMGDHVYVSAQSREEKSWVACEVEANDQKIIQARSQGAFVIATCSGFLEAQK